MTDWLSVCRDARAAVERVLTELPTRREREPVVGAEALPVPTRGEQSVTEGPERTRSGMWRRQERYVEALA